jgi:putative Holliday junction resolvase
MVFSLSSSSSDVDVAAAGVTLAIDYGRKRLGLALSDENGVTSRPFATWTRVNRRRDLARLRDLVRQNHVRRIVVGMPLHLDGTPSEMSEEARRFATRLEAGLGVPVVMMDERLSSWEAGRTLLATNPPSRRGKPKGSARRRRNTLDDVAAAVILRDYLDRARAPGGVRG